MRWFLSILLFSLVSSACYSNQFSEQDSELVVVADTHGAFSEYRDLLVDLKLIDKEQQWIGGERVLVSLGDNLDRGPDSRMTLDLLMDLEKQGASMKLLLGNHEVMNLIGDLRYVSKEEYAAFLEDESKRERNKHYKSFLVYSQLEESDESQAKFEKVYPPGYFGYIKAFSPKGKYGKWLLTKDIVANIDGNILLHGGISEQTLAKYPTIESLNKTLKAEMLSYIELSSKLIKEGLFKHHFSRKDRKEVAKALLDGVIKSKRFQSKKIKRMAQDFLIAAETTLFKGKSPIWYRGMAFCHQYAEEQVVDNTLNQYQADRVLLGHSPTNNSLVQSRFGGKVILLDTGMLKSHYQGNSNAVIIKDGQVQVFNRDKPTVLLPDNGVTREPQFANDLSDEYLGNFFSKAKITQEKVIAETYNKPTRLTFELDGVTHRGLFKSADSDPGLQNKSWTKVLDFSDRYHNDLAAFKLDRLLGLYMVPYTQTYKYEGKQGALQFWVEESTTRTTKKEQNLTFRSYCDDKKEMDIMKIFDKLIYNVDRNTGNILYSTNDGSVWLIDHSRGFRSKKPAVKHDFKLPDYISPSFLEALKSLNRSTLRKELKGLLHREQVQGIISRRDKIIEHYAQ